MNRRNFINSLVVGTIATLPSCVAGESFRPSMSPPLKRDNRDVLLSNTFNCYRGASETGPLEKIAYSELPDTIRLIIRNSLWQAMHGFNNGLADRYSFIQIDADRKNYRSLYFEVSVKNVKNNLTGQEFWTNRRYEFADHYISFTGSEKYRI